MEKHTEKIIRNVAIGGLLSLTVIGAGIAAVHMTGGNTTSPEQPAATEQEEATVTDEQKSAVETTMAKISLVAPKPVDENGNVDASAADVAPEGFTSTSTPAIVHFTGCCSKTEGVETYHAITADEAQAGAVELELPTGRYDVEFISPINEDGSIYRVGEAHKVVVSTETQEEHLARVAEAEGISVEEAAAKSEADASEYTGGEVKQEFTKVPAEEVTADDVQAILDKTAEAVAKGDDTLAGEKGENVIAAVTEHAAKTGKVDAEVIEAAQTKAHENLSNNVGASATDKAAAVASGQSVDAAKPSSGHWETRTKDVTKYRSVPVEKTREVPVYGEETVYEERPVYGEEPVYEEDTSPVYTGSNIIFVEDGYTIFVPEGQPVDNAAVSKHEDLLMDKGFYGNFLVEDVYDYTPRKVQTGTRQVQTGTERVAVGTRQVQTGTRTETYTEYENQPYTEKQEIRVWVAD